MGSKKRKQRRKKHTPPNNSQTQGQLQAPKSNSGKNPHKFRRYLKNVQKNPTQEIDKTLELLRAFYRKLLTDTLDCIQVKKVAREIAEFIKSLSAATEERRSDRLLYATIVRQLQDTQATLKSMFSEAVQGNNPEDGNNTEVRALNQMTELVHNSEDLSPELLIKMMESYCTFSDVLCTSNKERATVVRTMIGGLRNTRSELSDINKHDRTYRKRVLAALRLTYDLKSFSDPTGHIGVKPFVSAVKKLRNDLVHESSQQPNQTYGISLYEMQNNLKRKADTGDIHSAFKLVDFCTARHAHSQRLIERKLKTNPSDFKFLRVINNLSLALKYAVKAHMLAQYKNDFDLAEAKIRTLVQLIPPLLMQDCAKFLPKITRLYLVNELGYSCFAVTVPSLTLSLAENDFKHMSSRSLYFTRQLAVRSSFELQKYVFCRLWRPAVREKFPHLVPNEPESATPPNKLR